MNVEFIPTPQPPSSRKKDALVGVMAVAGLFGLIVAHESGYRIGYQNGITAERKDEPSEKTLDAKIIEIRIANELELEIASIEIIERMTMNEQSGTVTSRTFTYPIVDASEVEKWHERKYPDPFYFYDASKGSDGAPLVSEYFFNPATMSIIYIGKPALSHIFHGYLDASDVDSQYYGFVSSVTDRKFGPVATTQIRIDTFGAV